MRTPTLSPNPFQLIVSNLTDDPKAVTVDYLEDLLSLMDDHGVYLETLTEAFMVLEYLNFHNAIQLDEHQDKSYTIRKKIYG